MARKEYQKSLAYLIRAIDVNQRTSPLITHSLMPVMNWINRTEALDAARAATIPTPLLQCAVLYGTLLRLDHSYEKAEIALSEAKKLSQKRPVPEVHWQLALLYNRLGRNQEAADELEIYLKLQPGRHPIGKRFKTRSPNCAETQKRGL